MPGRAKFGESPTNVLANIVNLTDNSTGTPTDTIGAITGDASVIDAIASLTAKINAIQTGLKAQGKMFQD